MAQSKRVVTLQMLIDAGAPERVIKQIRGEIDKLRAEGKVTGEQVSKAMDQIDKSTKKIPVTLDQVLIKLDQFLDQSLKAKTRVKKVATETVEETSAVVAKTAKQIDQSAGLAGAALTSFSNGLSDIPFGLRGVANNIGQTATMMGMLTAQTGSLRGALGAMTRQMMGPLGIIFLIQGLLAGLQIWQERNREVAKSINEITDSAAKEAASAQILITAIKSENVSREERGRLIDTLNKNYGTTIKNLEDETQLAHELDQAYKNIIESLKSKAAIQALEEELAPIIAKQIDAQKERAKWEKILTKSEKERAHGIEFTKEQMEDFEALAERMGITTEEVVAQQKKALIGLNAAGELSEEGSWAGIMKRQQDDLIRETNEQMRVLIKSYTDAFDIIDRTVFDQAKDKDKTKKQEKEKFDLIIVERKEGQARLQTEFDKFIEQEEGGYNTLNDQLQKNLNTRKLIQIDSDKVMEQMRQDERDRMQVDMALKREIMSEGLNLLVATTNLFFKASDKQNHDQFKRQKAFNVAIATIDMLMSAQSAYRSQIMSPDPTAPIRAAIAAAAAITSGLARINAIRQQQYNSSSASVPSGMNGSSGIDSSGRPVLPQTGFTELRPFEPPPEDRRVYVLDKEINEVRLRNQTVEVRAAVK